MAERRSNSDSSAAAHTNAAPSSGSVPARRPEASRGAGSGLAPGADQVAALRAKHYNATLVQRRDVHENLAIFRVRPDAGVPRFAAGQYVAVGLGYWERRLPGTQGEELPAERAWKLVRRPYSISCTLTSPAGAPQTCEASPYLEFYVTLIREAKQAPALTPRLFALRPGDRLFVQPRIVGNYRLESIGRDDVVAMLATGTGEAPHNAMAAELLAGGHRGPIVVATCVRRRSDLGYLAAHQRLMANYANYRYLWYTTREPRNLDVAAPDYVGLERLQTVYGSGRLAAEAGCDLSPQRTHVFLCGNPMMIGLHRSDEPPPDPPGMLQLLLAAGFHDGPPAGPGQVRYEKYW